jgi:NADPH-ferrihemoprotein reductase
MDSGRNCVHIELNTEGSGITYQHGDHVGVWPSNPNLEVDRLLCVLGLMDKKDNVISIESLDPALAKVPFPVPATYVTALRHYIDINAVVGRQILGALSKFAPSPAAEAFLQLLNTNKAEYASVVAGGCLKLGEVLQKAAGDDLSLRPSPENTTAWPIPFDLIVSAIPRLQPRYYSISSSPKMHPNSIHVTAVVLKYESLRSEYLESRWVYGVGSNFILNLKLATNGESALGDNQPPTYVIEGPRGAYREGNVYKSPIHVRRSTFRLPTNPKSPVIMIGPGSVCACSRSFIYRLTSSTIRVLPHSVDLYKSAWPWPVVLWKKMDRRRSLIGVVYLSSMAAADRRRIFSTRMNGLSTRRNCVENSPCTSPSRGSLHTNQMEAKFTFRI